MTNHSVELAVLRERLTCTEGPRFWKSLEEIAETEEFQHQLHREFPGGASEWNDPAGRRNFLRLMGASLALAGLTACTRQPKETIVPYVRAPEEIVPGKPLFFATAMPLGGFGTGVLVESHMGRPTKVEGNPDHPASLGATDVFAQASPLTLYDPDRSQTVLHLGEISSWSLFLGELREALRTQRGKKGGGLRILTQTLSSPTLAHQLETLLNDFPAAKWHQYEPANRDNIRDGAVLAFGEYVQAQYHFGKAGVVLSLDSDFLCWGPGHLRYTRDFTARRRVRDGGRQMNRLYVVESMPSNTGAMADHRLSVRAGDVEAFARALAVELGVEGMQSVGQPVVPREWIRALVNDLKENRGASLVVAGELQPPAVHGLAHAMNQRLGNVGTTVVYTEPVEAHPLNQIKSLRELVKDIDAGIVEVLIIIGGNPVFDSPSDLGFRERLYKVNLRAHLGLYDDETSAHCHWHIPEAHFLEAWSDVRAYDGTVTIVQPLIAPLYDGRTAHELLGALSDKPERSSYDIVRSYWKDQVSGGKTKAAGNAASLEAMNNFESLWRRWLHDGYIHNSSFGPKQPTLRPLNLAAPLASAEAATPQNLEVVFRPDPHIHDGRFANNGWLQELPKPQTRLTWDNAALISPATAERLALRNEELVELNYRGRTVTVPIWIVPGHPADSVTLHVGYGRIRAGRVAKDAGVNAYLLRTVGTAWFGSGLAITKTGQSYALACTQHHQSMEGRSPVRAGTLEQYLHAPGLLHEEAPSHSQASSLYPEHPYTGYAWGMVIDLNACTGCNACTIACQAENNIAVVGKEQVIREREMHWIRVDRYYEGGLDNPAIYHQPVPCMQCENAPCEVVCPVAATTHSQEGLNDMAYNRCVGTRYCANNCPYKVRRFNFLLYSDYTTPSLKLLRNPDVSVRSRGVMEKCTYCVQRINAAKIEAEKQDRLVQDGEITTACEAVCPSQAIVFGNVNDPRSRVSKLKGTKLNYSLLEELNTRPRTSYLEVLRNPNPDIKTT